MTAINGTNSSNFLSGTDEADIILGLDGDDFLVGHHGNDLLQGDEGNDTYSFNKGDGTDEIWNVNYDNSKDVVELNGVFSSAVTIYDENNSLIIKYGNTDQVKVNRFFYPNSSIYQIDSIKFISPFNFLNSESWSLADIASRHNGTNNHDTLYGFNGLTNTINGLDGNDTIIGGDGNDLLNGGNGDDYIDGGNGDDKLNGGDGNDTLVFQDATNGVNVNLLIQEATGAGNDKLYGFENIVGGKFNDILIGNNKDNVISEDGFDPPVGIIATGNDMMFGFGGNDSLYSDNGNDTLNGGSGDDYLYGGINNCVLNGNSGNDTIADGNLSSFQLGNDLLNGGSGDDTLTSSAGNDTLIGGGGNDNLYFVNGQFYRAGTMKGGAGDDNLYGWSIAGGKLDGGDGNDYIEVGIEKNTLVGGNGADILVITHFDPMIAPFQTFTLKNKIILSETTPATDIVKITSDYAAIYRDTIVGFTVGNGVTTEGEDQLYLDSTSFNTKNVASDTSGFDGVNRGIIRSHAIQDGMIMFSASNSYSNPIFLDHLNLNSVFKYLNANLSSNGIVAFTANDNTYVFDGSVVELVGVTATNLNTDGLSDGGIWLIP